jgi:hypothetical protein
MSLDARDLRRGMDVFSSDGVYLGTVIRVRLGRRTRSDGSPTQDEPRPSDGSRDPTSVSGEALGPMPTAVLGNGGPRRQTAANDYATRRTAVTGEPSRLPAELIVLRLLLPFGWSTPRPRLRRFPVSMVQAVSYERIVLSVTASSLGD